MVIKGVHLEEVQELYRAWLDGIEHKANTGERREDILNVFKVVSPSVFNDFVKGMKVTDHRYRYQDGELIFKVKMELYPKYFAFNMNQLIEKITDTLNDDTINALFTARPEPVGVICQRIVVRQYAVMNQRIERRLKSKVDTDEFRHCDLCAHYTVTSDLERVSSDNMRLFVENGFHPHNSNRIVDSLARRNKVRPEVIKSAKNTERWLAFVKSSDDVWSICDSCLGDILPYSGAL